MTQTISINYKQIRRMLNGAGLSALLLLAPDARAAFTLYEYSESYFDTEVAVPGNNPVHNVGFVGADDPLITLLYHPLSNEWCSFGASASMGEGNGEVSTFAGSECGVEFVGNYTASAKWHGEFIRTSSNDELTIRIQLPDQAFQLIDNGRQTENGLSQMAEWNLDITLHGPGGHSVKKTKQLRAVGHETNRADWTFTEPGDIPLGGTFTTDGSHGSYTAPLEFTTTINLEDAGIEIGDDFQVDQTMSTTAFQLDGETNVTTNFSARTELPQTTREKIVAYRVNITDVSGTTMKATFDPAELDSESIPMSSAARIWDIAHFNWVQYLIHAPADWTFTNNGTPVTLPMIDTWPTPNLVVSDASAHKSIAINRDHRLDDTNDPYFDYDVISEFIINDGTTLLFTDTPSFPLAFLAPDEYLEFYTELVGVKADGTIVFLSGIPGTAFTWKTNAVNVFDKFCLGVLDDDGTGILRGGVFDVRYVTCGNPDGDAYCNVVDNCPFYATANRSDTDGDGRGNECECADQNGDGRNTVSDLVAINVAIFNSALATSLCDGTNDGQCNVNDIIAANIEIFSPTNTSTCLRQPVPGP